MNRVMRQAGIVGGCGTILLALGAIGTASGTPGDDEVAASCAYTLTAPFVADVSGRKMVSATLTSLPCTGNILPNQQTVCIQLQGLDSQQQCASIAGYGVAQVYFAPYRAGGTYVSTGSGCGAVPPTFVSTCATKGPKSATL